MFVYCNNSAPNAVDYRGSDAIWIQEGRSAAGMGHTGLLVQNSEGSWFYFYWGPQVEGASALLGYVPSRMVLEEIDSGGRDLSYLCNVVIAIKDSENPFVKDRSGKITEIIYYEGDYSATYNWLSDLQKKQHSTPFAYEYHLLFNNCVQKTIEALSQSNDSFSDFCFVVPNSAIWAAWYVPHVCHQYRPVYWASKTQSYAMLS